MNRSANSAALAVALRGSNSRSSDLSRTAAAPRSSGPGHAVRRSALVTVPASASEGRRGPPAEMRLLVALLAEAIHTLRKNSPRQTRRQRRLYHEVEVWIGTRGAPSAFGFDNVCETLGIDPDYLRRGLFGVA